jgi:hypothetical protein
MKDLTVWVDVEGRSLLFVKGAAAFVVTAGFLEVDIAAYQSHDVDAIANFLDSLFWNSTHGCPT